MRILSVVEESNIKFYILEDNQDKYIAEEIFSGKSPRSRVLADIKRNLDRIVEERSELINHPSYIYYQGLKQVKGELCLLRKGNEVYKPLNDYLQESELTLEDKVDFLLDLAQIALEIGKEGIVWQGLTMDSLWIDQNRKLRVMDPDIVNEISKYRNTNNIGPIEIYQAPEIFKDMIQDVQSLIYSVGIIMYYLFTGEKPFKTKDKSDIDKSDLVHDILNNSPVEPIFINPKISLLLNNFIMSTLAKDKADRVKNWDSYIQQLEKIKSLGVKATGEETLKYKSQAAKVINSSLRRKRFKNFWRKRWISITVIISIFILMYIMSMTGGSEPYITKDTPANKVVEYFYQAIEDKNAMLLEETSIIELKNLDNMVAQAHVIEKMRSAYNLQSEGVFGIEDFSIRTLSEKSQTSFEAKYIFYYNTADQLESLTEEDTQTTERDYIRYQTNMTDILELGNVEGIWRIVNIEGSIDYIIQGQIMDLFNEE